MVVEGEYQKGGTRIIRMQVVSGHCDVYQKDSPVSGSGVVLGSSSPKRHQGD